MAAAEEMQALVLQMLQQQRMVQRQLELVLQEMNLLQDETRPPEERVRKALELQGQVLQMLHEQGLIMHQLRLALQHTHGLRDDAVEAAAARAQAVRDEYPDWQESSYSSAPYNSSQSLSTEDDDQPPGGAARGGGGSPMAGVVPHAGHTEGGPL